MDRVLQLLLPVSRTCVELLLDWLARRLRSVKDDMDKQPAAALAASLELLSASISFCRVVIIREVLVLRFPTGESSTPFGVGPFPGERSAEQGDLACGRAGVEPGCKYEDRIPLAIFSSR